MKYSKLTDIEETTYWTRSELINKCRHLRNIRYYHIVARTSGKMFHVSPKAMFPLTLPVNVWLMSPIDKTSIKQFKVAFLLRINTLKGVKWKVGLIWHHLDSGLFIVSICIQFVYTTYIRFNFHQKRQIYRIQKRSLCEIQLFLEKPWNINTSTEFYIILIFSSFPNLIHRKYFKN